MTLPRLTPGRPAAVVFDCDGVLIESVSIKTEAFPELFPEYPQHHAAIVNHHQTHLGISRFEKFEWIYRELFDKRLAQDESRDLGQRFSQLVFERAARCPEVEGAEDSLRQLGAHGVPLFVASGTPQDELVALIETRGWSAYFRTLYGSPRSKPEILSTIASDLSITPQQMVFVGDGLSDFNAAKEAGARFVLRETEAQRHHFHAFEGLRVSDLVDLPERLFEAAALSELDR